MASLDEFFAGLFGSLGPVGSLLALLLIFAADAAVFPALPELWAVLTYVYRPASTDALWWAFLILGIAVAGEAIGNTTLYLIVRRLVVQRGRMPRVLERAMRKWMEFLILHDERIILVNRIAPVVPFVGAFIATLGWNFRRSLLYVVLGAGLKYSALLALVGIVGIAYDPVAARWIALALVLVTIVVSALGSALYRGRLRRSKS